MRRPCETGTLLGRGVRPSMSDSGAGAQEGRLTQALQVTWGAAFCKTLLCSMVQKQARQYHSAIYRSERYPYQKPQRGFTEKGKADPKIHMQLQGTLNSQNNLREEHSWGFPW